jgi:adenosylhomocysteine nucleosidase
MTNTGRAPRVAMLAPMKPELRPLVSMIPLQRVSEHDLPTHTGTIGGVEVVAAITGIGMEPARKTAERLLDAVEVDHLMVVGIAGGVGPTVDIGDLVMPEVYVDGASGKEYRPQYLGDVTPRGRIISSDAFGYDDATIKRFIDEGVVGLDMETAAIAAVCEERGCAWSAFRAISDRGDDETVDTAVLEMAGTDGSGDSKAIIKYLLRRPWKIVHLSRLAKGTNMATKAAARAAIDAAGEIASAP